MTWQWTCLPCNATWRGAPAHVHRDYQEYRRVYWTRRLWWALRQPGPEGAQALVARVIARTELAELLGWRE